VQGNGVGGPGPVMVWGVPARSGFVPGRAGVGTRCPDPGGVEEKLSVADRGIAGAGSGSRMVCHRHKYF